METARHVRTASAVVLAVMIGSLMMVSVASAAINSSRIRITINNSGSLSNTTVSNANTGGNKSEGSEGGDGDTGGDVTASGAGGNNNGGSSAGDGGKGGDADAGGLVDTGDAFATASSTNTLNDTEGNIVVVAPMDVNSSNIIGDVTNTGPLTNDTRARARTGDNTSEGSEGGNGDDGGGVTSGTGNNNNGSASAGDGGDGGSGGLGGEVLTGNATTNSSSTNTKNRVRFGISL